MTYRIVSFDGGGYRGVYSLRLLQRIQSLRSGVLSQADMFAGTSTGGLISLGLAAGHRTGGLLSIYQEQAPTIFKDTFLDDITDLGGLTGAEYSIDGLVGATKGILGYDSLKILREKSNKHLLIATYGLDLPTTVEGRSYRMARPKFFSTYSSNDENAFAFEVAAYTAAAPTYFPVYRGYTDGGICTPNPVMAAVTEVVKEAGVPLADIQVLSIGTGLNPFFVNTHNQRVLDWGVLEWAKVLPTIVVDGQTFFDETIAKTLLGSNYCRANGILPEPINMDEYGKTIHQRLIDYANSVDIDPVIAKLKAMGWGKDPEPSE